MCVYEALNLKYEDQHQRSLKLKISHEKESNISQSHNLELKIRNKTRSYNTFVRTKDEGAKRLGKDK